MKKPGLTELVELILCRPLLTRKDLARRFGCALRTIDDWKQNGNLPPPIRLKGSHIPLWRPCDIARLEGSLAGINLIDDLREHQKRNGKSRQTVNSPLRTS